MRLTKQTIDTLMAARDSHGCTDRAVLAKRLGIPYSSACGRVRRLIAAGLLESMSGDGSLWVTEAGLGELLRSAQS